MKKQEKGITLIALVVTIIVLLILAGVVISLVIGNNGLFNRAQDATNRWRKAEANEQEEMSNFERLYDETLNGLGSNNENDEIIECETYSLWVGEGSSGYDFTPNDSLVIQLLGQNDMGTYELIKTVFNEDFMEGVTDEEVVLYAFSSSMDDMEINSFEELVELLYNEGNIKNKHKNAKELLLEMFGGDLAQVSEFLQLFRAEYFTNNKPEFNELKIYNPDGTEYVSGYEVPYKEEEYIFTVKFKEKEKKIRVSINQYEAVYFNYTYFVSIMAMDIVNREILRINNAVKIVDKVEYNLELEDSSKHNWNYISANECLVQGINKIRLVTNENITIDNYFIFDSVN